MSAPGTCRYCGCTRANPCEMYEAPADPVEDLLRTSCTIDEQTDPTLCSRCAAWPVGFVNPGEPPPPYEPSPPPEPEPEPEPQPPETVAELDQVEPTETPDPEQ